MKRLDFIKSILLMLVSPLFLLKKKLKAAPESYPGETTVWTIDSELCTNCGICYDENPDDFAEAENGNRAVFIEGHWFFVVYFAGSRGGSEAHWYQDVLGAALRCPTGAIMDDDVPVK